MRTGLQRDHGYTDKSRPGRRQMSGRYYRLLQDFMNEMDICDLSKIQANAAGEIAF